ncbi:hypothetical protein QQP08_014187 [Theobroma cacao]|nr:hypothetical protein QQP08_014187 [Theobroma cacao]
MRDIFMLLLLFMMLSTRVLFSISLSFDQKEIQKEKRKRKFANARFSFLIGVGREVNMAKMPTSTSFQCHEGTNNYPPLFTLK